MDVPTSRLAQPYCGRPSVMGKHLLAADQAVFAFSLSLVCLFQFLPLKFFHKSPIAAVLPFTLLLLCEQSPFGQVVSTLSTTCSSLPSWQASIMSEVFDTEVWCMPCFRRTNSDQASLLDCRDQPVERVPIGCYDADDLEGECAACVDSPEDLCIP